ncbi:MAG TPA: hydroxymethylglutaryl-CoA lyase [Sphingobacteriaceae bacterium]
MKLIECPRDAMQGIHNFIPTEIKAHYMNLLLQVGFDTLDFGSFVSPKAIPQMQDTAEVVKQLDLSRSQTKLLAIIANLKGAHQAVQFDEISYLGFPFSVSETFQQRNTHSSIAQSLETVEEILLLCQKHNKTAVLYLSMGFGNPYGDEWNTEIMEERAEQLIDRGCSVLSIADTIGASTPRSIGSVFPALARRFPDIELGIHLHSTPEKSAEKINAAYNSGCKRFDSALKGYGGCPMAKDDLTGNIATETLIEFLEKKDERLNLNTDKWREAMEYSSRVFL